MRTKNFRRSARRGHNLRGSIKLQNYAAKSPDKQKWSNILANTVGFSRVSAFGEYSDLNSTQRVSDFFGNHWNLVKDLKDHYCVVRDNVWNKIRWDGGLPKMERSLYVIVYKSHLAPTLPIARQWIVLGYVTVNDVVETNPNYEVVPGDIIRLKFPNDRGPNEEDLREALHVSELYTRLEGPEPDTRPRVMLRRVPAHLEVSWSTLTVILSYVPSYEELEYPFVQ